MFQNSHTLPNNLCLKHCLEMMSKGHQLMAESNHKSTEIKVKSGLNRPLN